MRTVRGPLPEVKKGRIRKRRTTALGSSRTTSTFVLPQTSLACVKFVSQRVEINSYKFGSMMDGGN